MIVPTRGYRFSQLKYGYLIFSVHMSCAINPTQPEVEVSYFSSQK